MNQTTSTYLEPFGFPEFQLDFNSLLDPINGEDWPLVTDEPAEFEK